MAVSDVLFEAVEQISEYQSHGIIASHGDPELELIKDLMRAVRLMPGRDTPPGGPNTFDADLKRALKVYEQARQRAEHFESRIAELETELAALKRERA